MARGFVSTRGFPAVISKSSRLGHRRSFDKESPRILVSLVIRCYRMISYFLGADLKPN